MSAPFHHWLSLPGHPASDVLPVGSQRVLDSVVFCHIFKSLVSNQTTQYHRVRLLASAAAHSGDWLHVVPISTCGRRLSDEAIRVAVGLRLGSEICQSYYCICGALVDTRASHALSCKRNPGRSQRHHFINDLIWRAFSKAGFTSIKEQHGLLRSDNKRPDGLTLIPWRDGRCATWDVTVTDTVAPSYLSMSSACAASAAEAAAKHNEEKYIEIACNHHFFPSPLRRSVLTMSVHADFISALSHRISTHTDDPRETFFLFQRLSVTIQRFNAVCFANSFGNFEVEVRRKQPRYT